MRTLKHLIPAALLSAVTFAVMPACASQTYGYRGYDTGHAQRVAYDNGYRDGIRVGERDGRSGRLFEIERQSEWRDADNGYHRDYGDREFYRRSFRDGFRVGYSEGFNRYARAGAYPSAYPAPVVVPRATYSSAASQNGYRDGLEQGRNDARDHDRYDPAGAKRYREGDHDYHDRYGSREEYKREYRSAFQQGYDEGYRTARR